MRWQSALRQGCRRNIVTTRLWESSVRTIEILICCVASSSFNYCTPLRCSRRGTVTFSILRKIQGRCAASVSRESRMATRRAPFAATKGQLNIFRATRSSLDSFGVKFFCGGHIAIAEQTLTMRTRPPCLLHRWFGHMEDWPFECKPGLGILFGCMSESSDHPCLP